MQIPCELTNLFNDKDDRYKMLEVANSYGRYVPDEDFDNSQIILKYCDYYAIENGSYIAGICDKNKQVFGMMPHPERTNNKPIKEIILKIIEDRKING